MSAKRSLPTIAYFLWPGAWYYLRTGLLVAAGFAVGRRFR